MFFTKLKMKLLERSRILLENYPGGGTENAKKQFIQSALNINFSETPGK